MNPLEGQIKEENVKNSKWSTEEINNVHESLKDFDPDILPENFSAIFYGARRQGKTFLLKHLLSLIKDRFDMVIVFSKTAELYKKTDFSYVPEKNFINGFDDKMIEAILDHRYNTILRNKANKSSDQKKLERLLFIFDDIICEPHITNHPTLKKLWVLGRHSLVNCIILSQHTSGICPTIRRNCDFIVVFYPESSDTRETVSKEYLSLKNWQFGSELLKKATSDEFMSIVIMRDPSAREYSDKVFKFIAPKKQTNFSIKGIYKPIIANGELQSSINAQFNIKFSEDKILE